MDNLTNNIVSNFWIIATVLLTAAVGAHFLWRNNFKTRRATSCAAFRAAIHSIFIGLYPEPKEWPSHGNAVDIKLQSIFPALQAAVENFRPFVPRLYRWRFNRAWVIYLRGKNGSDIGHYYQYMGYSSPDRKIPDAKATFKRNVDRLLSYAKET